jgi:SPP1 family predicted phage head-tail adaptor
LLIAAGQYRHRITIQDCAKTENSLGEVLSVWQDVVTGASAWVEDLRGRELLAAQEIHGEVDTRIRLRYRSGINARMRVLFRGCPYNIQAVIRGDAMNVELILLCNTGLISGDTSS